MARLYLTFIVLFGMLGAMISTCSSRGTFQQESTHPPIEEVADARADTADSAGEDDESSSSTGPIQLHRSSDGHFYANVQINGEPIHMLVDTGATAIALSQEDAEAAGVDNDGDMDQVVGRGADGEVRGQIVRLDQVSLGDTSVQGLHAIVLSNGDQSLLGQNFLSQFSSVDIEGDTMVLR